VIGPDSAGLAHTPGSILDDALAGCDPTTGIVSVDADNSGCARVWRRADGLIEATTHPFPNWFLTTSLDLLADLPAVYLPAEALRAARGRLKPSAPLCVVELDSAAAAEADVYRYLVLTSNLAEVETALVEMCNKRDGGDAQSLSDLRGLVLVWHPIEQFLALTGRTYFKGMAFDDLRRLQFDLETTGLDEDRDRIFMVSMRDSTGWTECLDIGALTEAQLIEQLVERVRTRDPDVLENHNIFGFDLPFLVKRAARLGVRLSLGRDGSEPRVETDVFDSAERAEPFLRWRVSGREVIDTQHAVRRFAAAVPDMRRHGLKEAARYFGIARTDREYVSGIDVWPTFRADPQRVRRYAASDVEEADGLSRRLLPLAFGLAARLPRAYERIAADSGPTALWELLLVRAYLLAGRAIGAPSPRLQPTSRGAPAELMFSGVFGASARAVAQRLLPCVVARNGIGPANDELGVLPRLVAQLLSESKGESALALATTAHRYLADQGLFSDPRAAADAATIARQVVDRVLAELRAHGCVVVEVDGEQVLFSVPESWTDSVEREVADAVATDLPSGVRLTFADHFEATYARGPRSAITLRRDGTVTLVGATFRPGRLERFGEAFMQQAAPCLLRGDAVGLRQVFLSTVHRLRCAQIGLEELCVQVVLQKSPRQYRQGGMREEPYEVMLAAGVRSWRVGQRIRYFRAHANELHLLREGEAITSAAADTEYYVQRLANVYAQQFAQAFQRPDFLRIFRIPEGTGPFDEPATELATIRPIQKPVQPPEDARRGC
jgi:DNA polymerase, archaea type